MLLYKLLNASPIGGILWSLPVRQQEAQESCGGTACNTQSFLSAWDGYDRPTAWDTPRQQVHSHTHWLLFQVGRSSTTPIKACWRCCQIYLFCKYSHVFRSKQTTMWIITTFGAFYRWSAVWKPWDSDNRSRKRVCERAFCRVVCHH